MYIAVSSKTMPASQLDQYAESMMGRRLSMVSGVARVQVFGSQKYAVRAQADPAKLAAYQIDLEQVRGALSSGSVNLPAGSLYGYTKAYTVQSDSQLTNAAQFARLIVTYKNGSPVHLDEVAHVFDSVSNERTRFWINGGPSIVLAVQKQPGSNTVQVADSVKALLPVLKQSIPAGVEIGQSFDASRNIRESIGDVKFTLLLTIAGHRRHLRFLAQRFGHDHSQPGRAALAPRHIRGHEAVGLHHRHAVDDGHDALCRLCGR